MVRICGLLFGLMVLFASATAEESIWHQNYSESVELAKYQKKGMLLFFGGAEGSCGYTQLKKALSEEPTFRQRIGSLLICVEIDVSNGQLKDSLNVFDMPCLILLDEEQREMTRFCDLATSMDVLSSKMVKELTFEIEELVLLDRTLKKGMKTIATLEGPKLVQLYQIAERLNDEGKKQQLIQKGIESSQRGYFLVEAYRTEANHGQRRGSEAITLRQKINQEFYEDCKLAYSLALIDFQQLAAEDVGQIGGADKVVAPLKEYLERFEKIDIHNSWRIQMMIAQVYLGSDEWDKASDYARLAYEIAPMEYKEEIAHSLDYIHSQTSEVVNR